MNLKAFIAILLIAAGVGGLMRGQFSYTREIHEGKIGSLELSVKEQQTVDIPDWLDIGVIAFGLMLLISGRNE